MHRTALSGTQRRTRTRSCRTRTLKNGLAWNRSTRRGTPGGRAVRNGLSRLNRRGLVNRTGSSLRNDHARSRSLWTRRGGRRCCCSRTRWLNRRRRRCTRNRQGSRSTDLWRRCHWTGRRWAWRHAWRGRGRSLGRNNWRYWRCNRPRRGNCRGSNNSGRNWSWRGSRWSSWLRGYRSSCRRFGLMRRRGSGFRRCSRYRRSSRLLLIKNRLQHVSGLGDVRQVNLGFDFVGVGMRSTTGLARAMPVPRAFEVHTNFFRFVLFERTGMCLLLGDANFG